MDREEIFEKVKNILVKIFYQKEPITEDTNIYDLDMDSLDRVGFVVEMEMEFKIQMKDAEIENFFLIKEYIDYIKNITNEIY